MEVDIAEVGMDGEGRVFVRLASGDFEHVYRAGMEVYWESSSRRLSHPHPLRDWTPIQWFQQIVAAVWDEYRVRLKLTDKTTWIEIPPEIRAGIETNRQPNGS